jgi:hypothetical protein
MTSNYTDSETENVKNWIIESLQTLIQEDGDLLRPESVPSIYKLKGERDLNRELHETTINHRLAIHLENLMEKYGMSGYYVDIEYNRYINDRKMVRSLKTGKSIEVRPDIVVHKRTRLDEPVPHFLVVEAKKHELNDKDRNHIKDIMHDENYLYKYGMLISYYSDPRVIQVNLLTLPGDDFSEDKFIVNKQ